MSISFSDEIVVICGPMFSGKSKTLIISLDNLRYAEIPFLVCKPSMDRHKSTVATRFENISVDAISLDVDRPEEVFNYLDEKSDKSPRVVVFDEAQFFSKGLVDVVNRLNRMNVSVWIAGLDLDAWGEPFGPMPELMCLATKVIKKRAVCAHCKGEATRTATNQNRPNDSNVIVFDKIFFPLCCSCYYKLCSHD